MKDMFEIVSKGNPTELEMSVETLDLATRISNHINDNFDESDFFTICNTAQEDLTQFVSVLDEAQAALGSEDTKVSLTLNYAQYSIFENVFLHAQNFMDEEFDEEFDTIDAIADVIMPPPSLTA